jgi:predicted metal-dependent enzyme (double-stranded beta helix superfamily)
MPWLNDFAAECRRCINQGGGAEEILPLLSHALTLQTRHPQQTEIDRIVYRSDDLFILSLAQPAYGNTPIHTHGFWGVIGISSGCEENAFFKQTETGLVETSRIALHRGDAIILAPNIIHKIRNPQGTSSLGLHVYGGNLSAKRSMWSPYSKQQMPLEQLQFESWCEELTSAASKGKNHYW